MTFCTQCGKSFEDVGSANLVRCQTCLASDFHPPLSAAAPAAAPRSPDAGPEQWQPLAGSEPRSEEFDPYYTWLGIPPSRQPANHYQLLGVTDFEQNVDVLSNAADRQMSHLRSQAIGLHSNLSQQLLNEVASARICLLNSATKAAYDQRLRSAAVAAPTAPAAPSAPIAPSGPPVPQMMPPSGLNSSPSATTTAPSKPYTLNQRSTNQRGRTPDKSVQKAISIVLGGLMGCAIGWFIITVYLPKLQERKAQVQRNASTKETPQPQWNLPSSPRPQPRVPRPTPKIQPSGASVSEAERIEQASSSPFEIEPSPPPKFAQDRSMSAPVPSSVPINGIASSSQPYTPNAIPLSLPAVPKFVSLPEVSTLLSNPIVNLPQGVEDISLRLLDGAETVAGDRLLTEESSESETRVWTVSISSAEESESAPPEAIGEFLLTSGALSFKWFASAGPDEKSLIENCALRLSVGEEEHIIAMRSPAFVEPLKFDMDNRRETHEFAIANRPSADRLVLELGDLASFPATASYRNGTTEAPVGKSAVIEFKEVPGAELEIRFITKDADKVGIAVSPMFRENAASRVEMTKSQLDKSLSAAQQSIARTQASIQQWTAQAAQLERLVSSSTNGAQALGYRGKINQLSQKVKSAQVELRQSQATLAAGPKIRSFIDSLHGNVRLDFKVKMVADERSRISLIDSESASRR